MLSGISNKIHLLLLVIVLPVTMITSYVGLHNSALKAVEHTALQSARVMAMTMNAARIHYNKNVAKKLSSTPDIYIGADYHDKPQAIPNPATFTIEVAEMVSKQQPNIRVRMYSDHPFPHREEEGGPQTDFEVTALESFRRQKANGQQPEAVFKSFHVGNNLEFDYIEPLVMQAACIECHNQLLSSPKRDWKVGDIRGGLSIRHVMVENNAFEDLENIAKLSIAFIAIFSTIMLIWNFRQSRKQLQSNTQNFLKIANSDPLTGLLNRRGFEQAIQHSWREHRLNKQYMSIIYCDLDDFKTLNDQHGHATGDMQLINAAGIISTTLRQGIDFAARIGGDEFVIVLSNTNQSGAIKVAKRLLESGKTVDSEHTLKWSLGIACTKVASGISATTLISRADKAMYQAKSVATGGYRVYRGDAPLEANP
ncbi:diguanylate cyclase domain-containing protein [Pseudoteredinibacter isoporae]|uniref:diguanylate cyclase domain-containing protein n=1 Tax=Pseudoteredinibacter isoporae TaxID=570281 RepID=UPI003109070E